MTEVPSALKRVNSAHRGVHVSVPQPPAEDQAAVASAPSSPPRPSYSGILAHVSETDTMRTVWKSLKGSVPHEPVVDFGALSLGESAAPTEGSLRLVLISDTHAQHAKLPPLPPGDVLVHCGNLTQDGTPEEVENFVAWLGTLKQFKTIVVVGGSRDAALDDGASFPIPRTEEPANSVRRVSCQVTANLASALSGVAKYVPHGSFVVEGVTFFASQFAPQVDQGAFGYNRRSEGHRMWEGVVASKPDVLITHVPPLGQRDMVAAVGVVGCADLLDAVEAAPPLLHVFGHVHQGRGASTNGKTLFVNSSSVARGGTAPGAEEVVDQTVEVLPPFVVDVPKPQAQAERAAWVNALTTVVRDAVSVAGDTSTTSTM